MRKILINTKLLFLNLRPIPSDQAINIIISTCYNHSPFILRYTLSSYSHFFIYLRHCANLFNYGL